MSNFVWSKGKRYQIVHPVVPDPDHWVRLIPAPEKVKLGKQQVCDHTFYNVGLSNGGVTGQRCSKCGFQEWF